VRRSSCPGAHLTAADRPRDAVLHGVLDERLHDEAGHGQRAQLLGHVHLHLQALFEAFAFDVEIVLHEFDLAAERGHLAIRLEHAAQERRQAKQRLQRARRR
jgi:hypothetical protein